MQFPLIVRKVALMTDYITYTLSALRDVAPRRDFLINISNPTAPRSTTSFLSTTELLCSQFTKSTMATNPFSNQSLPE
jgi:hypothetical protein